jgi:hypothetical protein
MKRQRAWKTQNKQGNPAQEAREFSGYPEPGFSILFQIVQGDSSAIKIFYRPDKLSIGYSDFNVL